jgi:hypothetical protein
MLLSFAAGLTTAQFLSSLKVVESCRTASMTFTRGAPVLKVTANIAGDSLTLDAELLATEGTSPDRDSFRPFIAVDGQLILLNLPSFGKISLTYPGLSTGSHFVRYGVFYRTTVMHDAELCPVI